MNWIKENWFKILKELLLSACLFVVITLLIREMFYCDALDLKCKIGSSVDDLPIYILTLPITILTIYIWNTLLSKLNSK